MFFEENNPTKLMTPATKGLSDLMSHSRVATPVTSATTSHYHMSTKTPLFENRAILSQQQPQQVPAKQPMAQKLVNFIQASSAPIRSMSAGLSRDITMVKEPSQSTLAWVSNNHSTVDATKVKSSRFDFSQHNMSAIKWEDMLALKTLQDSQFKSLAPNQFFSPSQNQTLLRPYHFSTIAKQDEENSNLPESQGLSSMISPTKSDRIPLRLKQSNSMRTEGKRGSAMHMLELPRFSKNNAMLNALTNKVTESSSIVRPSFYHIENLRPLNENWIQPPKQDSKLSPVLSSDKRAKAPIKALRMFEHRSNRRSFHDKNTSDKVEQRVATSNLGFGQDSPTRQNRRRSTRH
jgi:hypothetical protein